jgi:hypothetical protein
MLSGKVVATDTPSISAWIAILLLTAGASYRLSTLVASVWRLAGGWVEFRHKGCHMKQASFMK